MKYRLSVHNAAACSHIMTVAAEPENPDINSIRRSLFAIYSLYKILIRSKIKTDLLVTDRNLSCAASKENTVQLNIILLRNRETRYFV